MQRCCSRTKKDRRKLRFACTCSMAVSIQTVQIVGRLHLFAFLLAVIRTEFNMWAAPLNELQIAVGSARPHPWARERTEQRRSTGSSQAEFSCQKIRQKIYILKMCQKRMSEDMSEDVLQICQTRMPERVSEERSEEMSEEMSKDMSEDMSKDMSEKNIRKNVRRIVRRYVNRNVRRNIRRYAKRYVRRYVKRYVRKECQKECQKNCQKICQ